MKINKYLVVGRQSKKTRDWVLKNYSSPLYFIKS